MFAVAPRRLVRWPPAWLLLAGIILAPMTAHAQVEIKPVARDFSELNPGESGTVTITIENTGSASVDAFLTLDVPSELQLDAITPSAGFCTQDEGIFGTDVECTFDGVGGEATREVAVTVTATDSLGSHIIDLASGRQGQAEPDEEGLTIVEVFSPGEADLAVDCTTEADTLIVGQDVAYSCTVTNTTTTSGGTAGKRVLAAARDVHVTAFLSGLAGEILDIFSEDPDVACAASYSESGGCDIDQLAEGESFSFATIIEWSESGTGTFRALVNANTSDSNGENNDVQVMRTVVEEGKKEADIAVTVDDSGPPVANGRYEVETTVVNNGPDQAGTVVLTVDFPDDDFEVWALDLLSGDEDTECETESSGGTETATCIIDDMKPGEERVVSANARVMVAEGGMETEVTGSTTTGDDTKDPVDGNDFFTLSRTVTETPPADLKVSKFDGTGEVIAGDTLTYTIIVTNLGDNVATDVLLLDDLSPLADLEFEEVDLEGGCGPGYVTDYICELGTLAPDDSVKIQILVRPTGEGAIHNIATVWASTTDDNLQNNFVSTTTEVFPAGQLVVDKALTDNSITHLDGNDDPPPPSTTGVQRAFTIDIINTSEDVAKKVIMEDKLPTGLALPVAPASNCEVNLNVVRCELARLNPGEEKEYRVSFIPMEVRDYVNTAQVRSENLPGDEDSAELVVEDSEENTAGTAEPEEQTVDRGEQGSVSFTTINTSDDELLLGVSFKPGTGLDILNTSTSNGGCTENDDGESTCYARVEGGGSYNTDVTFEATEAGSYTISADVGDYTSATATVTVEGEVQPLDVEVTTAETEPVVGTDFTYTVEVANTGTEPAPDVEVKVETGFIKDESFITENIFDFRPQSPDCEVLGSNSEFFQFLLCKLGTLASGETRTFDLQGYFVVWLASRLRATASSSDGRSDEDTSQEIHPQRATLYAQTVNSASEGGGGNQAAGKRQTAFDLYVDSTRVVDDLAAGDATAFAPTSIGRTTAPVQVVDGAAPDNSDPLLATEVDLLGEDGTGVASAHTLILTGTRANPDLLVRRGARQQADDPAIVDVFLAHAAPGAPVLEASLFDRSAGEPAPEPLADSLAYGQTSDYVALDPATYDVEATARADDGAFREVFRLDLSERAGEALALVLSGDSTGAAALSAIDTTGARSDGEVVTSTEPAGDAPGTFVLYGSYPNPVAVTTTIRYDLPKPAAVRMAVYDVLGRRVTTLVDEARQPAGRHEATFDAQDVPPGVYFYRIEMGDVQDVKKMVVVR